MPTDIDMIVTANMVGSELNGQGHTGALAASMLPHHPPALRVEAACASGGVAIHTACALLESGKAETILVVGAEKMTDASNEEVTRAIMSAGDSEKDAACGLTFAGIFGLTAQRYMHEFGLTREELSIVSAHHHAMATKNPYAQFQRAIDPHVVSNSAPVADPLRLLDCSPISDGAAAIILSSSRKSPVRIIASQLATDSVSLADRSTIVSFMATQTAMQQALMEADIDLDDIDLVELHDCFSIAALIHLEDMGFAEQGRGIDVYQAGTIPINRSGGLKACGHPIGATGVKQVLDCWKQLTGIAANQVRDAHIALAHNIGGVAATCALHLLERDA
jgi:acetyl-CoA C-acetyltransferase